LFRRFRFAFSLFSAPKRQTKPKAAILAALQIRSSPSVTPRPDPPRCSPAWSPLPSGRNRPWSRRPAGEEHGLAWYLESPEDPSGWRMVGESRSPLDELVARPFRSGRLGAEEPRAAYGHLQLGAGHQTQQQRRRQHGGEHGHQDQHAVDAVGDD